MSDILLTNIVSRQELVRLAPDLDFPSLNSSSGFKSITFNPAGAITPALELNGKWAIAMLNLSSITAETHTIRLTIDGVIIWNSTFVTGTTLRLLGYSSQTNDVAIKCNSHFLLEVQSTTDTSETLDFTARPTL